jgi:hypothetical protein
MTKNEPLRTPRLSAGRRLLVAGLVVLGASGLAACTPHKEAQIFPCPAASPRGAPQLPRIGLTPRELKAQQKC